MLSALSPASLRKTNTLPVVCIAIYILIQFIHAASPVPFISDSANYVSYARLAIQQQTWYPNPGSINSAWIVAPVYINYIEAILRIFGSEYVILWFNIILNMMQMALVALITRRLYGNKTAMVAATIYMLYLNNLGLVMLNLTELMFGIFILLSIWLFTAEKTNINALFCGLAAGLAMGVRPTASALVMAFILLYLYDLYTKTASHKRIALILAGFTLYCIAMGSLSWHNIHRFEITSTTGPSNLIMSANDKAKGTFDGQFFKTDSTYLAIKTYPERDQYLKQRSIQYIKDHPLKWIALIPRKIYSTFIADGWTIEYLLHSDRWNINTYLKGDALVKQEFKALPLWFKIKFWIYNIWQQLIYAAIMILFLYQLIRLFRAKASPTEYIINLFIVIGVALSIITSVGTPRYKYNFLIAAIVLVSPVVIQLYDKLRRVRRDVSEKEGA